MQSCISYENIGKEEEGLEGGEEEAGEEQAVRRRKCWAHSHMSILRIALHSGQSPISVSAPLMLCHNFLPERISIYFMFCFVTGKVAILPCAMRELSLGRGMARESSAHARVVLRNMKYIAGRSQLVGPLREPPKVNEQKV